MEFKYRAVDVDRSPTAMPPASSGFLPEPANLGCNIRLPSQPTNEPPEDRVWEAIRREIEKEHIRQEIIAAETARRRELVAEVMREMATEREMAMRRGAEKGMSFEERLTMWINYTKSTNQNSLFEQQRAFSGPLSCTGPHSLATSPKVELPPFEQISNVAGAKVVPVLKSNKDKLIVLDRPDPKGAKRKAEEPPAVGPEERHLLRLKKKPREEWSCALCKVSATCERGLNEHLQGKRHKAKEAALRGKQISKSSTGMKGRKEVSSKPTCLEQVDGEKKGKCETKIKPKFWCEICDVGTFSKAVMRKHDLGKKHKARMRRHKEHPEAAPTSLATVTPAITTTATDAAAAAITVTPSDAVTETGIKVSREKKVGDAILEGALRVEQISESSTGMKGRNDVSSNPTCLEQVDGEKQAETAERCKTKKSKIKFWCEICNVGTFSKAVMRKHELGKKHKARIQQHKERPEAAPTSLPIFSPAVTTTASDAASATAAAFTVTPSNAVMETGVKDTVIQKKKVGDAIHEGASMEGQRVADGVVDETTVRTEFEKKRKFKFWCEICHIGMFSEGSTKTHMLGKKHKARLKKQCEAIAVLDTKLTSISSYGKRIAAAAASTAATAIPLISLNVAQGEKVPLASAPNKKVENADAEEARIDHVADEAVVEGPIVGEVNREDSLEEVRVENPAAEKRKVEEPMTEKNGLDEVMTEDVRREEEERGQDHAAKAGELQNAS